MEELSLPQYRLNDEIINLQTKNICLSVSIMFSFYL